MRDAGARAEQRLILLRGGVPGDVVLALGRLRSAPCADRIPIATAAAARAASWRARIRSAPVARAARALATSGTRSTANGSPAVTPSRASICAALAWASTACASPSAAAIRISSALAPTRLPRSTGVATTRPATSAATSRVFLRGERAAHADEALDWLLDGGNRGHVHGGRIGGRVGFGVGAVTAGDCKRSER